MTVSAVAADGSDFQSRQSTPLQPMGLGYEYVRDADLVGNAAVWAEEAVQKLSARSVEPGVWDLVLLPSHLFLTLHESIAHPTELDWIQDASLRGRVAAVWELAFERGDVGQRARTRAAHRAAAGLE